MILDHAVSSVVDVCGGLEVEVEVIFELSPAKVKEALTDVYVVEGGGVEVVGGGARQAEAVEGRGWEVPAVDEVVDVDGQRGRAWEVAEGSVKTGRPVAVAGEGVDRVERSQRGVRASVPAAGRQCGLDSTTVRDRAGVRQRSERTRDEGKGQAT